jgi:hypothetical protein
VVKLGSASVLNEQSFANLRKLAQHDHLTKTDYWPAALQEHEDLQRQHPGSLEATLKSARTLLAASRGADLPGVAFQIMRDMLRPSFPEADLFVIHQGSQFSPRLAVPRALLRDLAMPKPSADTIVFASSQAIMADTLLGLRPFVECVLTSLSPYVWGASVGRAGAVLIVTFGRPLSGHKMVPGDLLELSASLTGPFGRDTSWTPSATRTDLEHALNWWMARLDLLFSHTTEPANCARGDEYDPRIAHERIITVIQIFRACHMLATTQDPYTRQLLLYNVLDQLPGLNPRARWEATTIARKVRSRLDEIKSRMPLEVQRVLMPRATAAADALDQLATGFFTSELVTDDGIVLADKSGGSVVTAFDNATSQWLRVMRNSAHGFEQELTPRQRTLLAAHNAEIPWALPDLAWLHLLHLLCYPEQIAKQARFERSANSRPQTKTGVRA